MKQALLIIEQVLEELDFYLLDADDDLVQLARSVNGCMVNSSECTDAQTDIVNEVMERAAMLTGTPLPIEGVEITTVVHCGFIL